MSRDLLPSYPLGGDKGKVELGGGCLKMDAGQSLEEKSQEPWVRKWLLFCEGLSFVRPSLFT